MEMYFKLYNCKYNYTWIKYFKTEDDMNKFKNKIKYIPEISIIEDSRYLYYPNYEESYL